MVGLTPTGGTVDQVDYLLHDDGDEQFYAQNLGFCTGDASRYITCTRPAEPSRKIASACRFHLKLPSISMRYRDEKLAVIGETGAPLRI
jgi:hypothetical protein